ncbi:hypothetical protein SAMN03080615_00941 [Amphritea atlantica]|uniref:Rap1a immunity protein domain-containing protein n=1 Tax=Amphritea atlantica TaxID=355243 RepID=A0A1H9EJQ3_9GAMM|nr:hypothetical protein [Amphritea atlantica]SEQ25944.1 hypothetical protein SAMN03080615_00941 [Amphritea atlantica]
MVVIRLFVLFFIMQSAIAHSDEDLFGIIGVGYKSCDDYIYALENNRNQSLIYRSWVAGYITGFGHLITKNNSFIEYFDKEIFFKNMEAACRTDVNKTIYEVVPELMIPIFKTWKRDQNG